MKAYIISFFKFCPKSGRFVGFNLQSKWARFFMPMLGLVALLWCIFRVITKPSRISHPCVRAAIPLAVYFVAAIGGPFIAA